MTMEWLGLAWYWWALWALVVVCAAILFIWDWKRNLYPAIQRRNAGKP